MRSVEEISRWLNAQAPLQLSEPWDNTGLLLGDERLNVERIQTCLTLTPESVAEAIDRQAQLVIAHHPLPFKPLTHITTKSMTGRLLWQLATHSVAVYSPHTAWDSAACGINAMLAAKLNLQDTAPLVNCKLEGFNHLGAGRTGRLSESTALENVVDQMCRLIPDCRPRAVVGKRPIQRVAIACGSGGSLIQAALDANCDLFLTGEASFHTCLEAKAAEISMLLIGHFASERFAMVELARRLTVDFPDLDCWASQLELDPIQSLHTSD